MSVLGEQKQLISDLWLDQEDSHDRVDVREGSGSITGTEAGQLHSFIDDGFVSVQLDLADDFFSRFDRDIDHLWRTRPEGVGVGLPFEPGSISLRDAPPDARSRFYRLADTQSFTESARSLYVNAQLMRWMALILDERPVAFQSLYFERGSQQALHRDPMFVTTDPPSHMAASWVALEDVGVDCGPLMYVRGSHRLPWFEFAPDTIAAEGASNEMLDDWKAHRDAQLADLGLAAEVNTCSRGQAFIWHGSLLHGGAPVDAEASTRKSFVVHYSTASGYRERTTSMRVRPRIRRSWIGRERSTTDLIDIDGNIGFESPFKS